MQAAIQGQPSNESLPSHNAIISAETLPEYTLTNLSPPAEAHTRVTHTQAANPAVDDVEAQPHLASDAEANIARNNAPNVSIANFRICLAHFSISFVVPTVLPGSGRRQ